MATQISPSLSVSRDQALTIAKEDAEKAYVDLKPYRVTIKREADGWHVDYRLRARRCEPARRRPTTSSTCQAEP
jgi:hypothetical protein